jgi:hypothetical protein
MAGSSPIPKEAASLIAQVSGAAQRKDFSALRSMMVQDFTWSFGGDGSAEQALEEWKRRPAMLNKLSKAARSKCGFVSAGVVQCPARAGTSYRAGFKRLDGRWKMVYFVVGD